MIRRLRNRHRCSFAVLGVVLPLALGLVLLSRSEVPASAFAATDELSPSEPSEPPIRQATLNTGNLELRLRLWDSKPDRARVLELAPLRDPQLPDVLVYWADSALTQELPHECILLGSLAGTQSRRFSLPPHVQEGRLYLYSLAHQSLVATLELEP